MTLKHNYIRMDHIGRDMWEGKTRGQILSFVNKLVIGFPAHYKLSYSQVHILILASPLGVVSFTEIVAC